jgi:hypothetical protein
MSDTNILPFVKYASSLIVIASWTVLFIFTVEFESQNVSDFINLLTVNLVILVSDSDVKEGLLKIGILTG